MESTPFSKVAESTPVVDGLAPSRIVVPESPQEIADLLAASAAESTAITPFGGGTSLALGNVPERVAIALSTSNLKGIISYEPTDLTLSVWAGSRFADVNAQLAEHGQTLPIDVASDDSTIGGLIATGLAGPRRSGSPTFRDLLIGISAAHPSGTVTKGGGMVVKNVTGFDLMRLYLGSLGTLGVIVSANFRVLPLARYESTLVAGFSDLGAATKAGERVREGRARPVALEVFRSGGGWSVAVRLEGRESTVRLLASEVEKSLNNAPEFYEAEASKQWWHKFTSFEAPTTNGGDIVLRCSTRPRLGNELLHIVNEHLQDRGVSISHLSLSPEIGTVTARFAMEAADDPGVLVRDVRNLLLEVANNVTILASPPSLKTGIDVWGHPPETLDIMTALKAQFDPARVLNPGRFAGGI